MFQENSVLLIPEIWGINSFYVFIAGSFLMYFNMLLMEISFIFISELFRAPVLKKFNRAIAKAVYYLRSYVLFIVAFLSIVNFQAFSFIAGSIIVFIWSRKYNKSNE